MAVLIIACPCALGLATPTAPYGGDRSQCQDGGSPQKMERFYRKSKVQTIVFDKTGTLTEGKPVVTDIIGDEVEVLDWQPPWKKPSNTHWLRPLSSEKSEAGLEIQTVENFQALHGKGVSGQINGKQVLLGNAKMLDGMNISSTYQEKLEELEKRQKTVCLGC